MKDYLIWTKHGEGSSAHYMRTTDNTATNMINVEGPIPHVNECHGMPDVNETHHAMLDVDQTHHATPDVNETHQA